jgi:VanZ family protein
VQKNTKRSLAARLFLALAILYSLLITILSLIQLGKISIGDFNPTDKMMHAGAYFVLAFVWIFYYLLRTAEENKYKRGFFNISIAVIVYGMLIEVLQGTLTAYRTPDWADILANSLGVLIALTFCVVSLTMLKRLKRKINLFL